ncbi:hypothetical protein BD626DRAFT_473927 [Schizophyllum amplum]|uniref:C2H2-type domain-containing protein n=1 Tax=Schizophyllum amplum TaxID=97359 RepID=A0A550CX69_9AGAR|nr:hypothetical protein BD626DRAFT_473927 [Auriculariopsis ampla]
MQNPKHRSQHSFILSLDHCDDLAGDLLGAHKCDWNFSKQSCAKVLASHNLLAKHVKFHTTYAKPDKGAYQCTFGRCGHRSSSQSDLWAHILSTHLHRVELRCPVKSCTGKATSGTLATSRGYNMSQHFRDAHSGLLGRKICPPCDLFGPLARPAPLALVLQAPPALPLAPLPSSLVAASVQPCSSDRILALAVSTFPPSVATAGPSSVSASQQKTRHKQLDPGAVEDGVCKIEFGDLAHIPKRKGPFTFASTACHEEPVVGTQLDVRRNILTRLAPPRTEVSRAPVLLTAPAQIKPKISILYDAWEVEVDKRLPPEPEAKDSDDSDSEYVSSSESDSDHDETQRYRGWPGVTVSSGVATQPRATAPPTLPRTEADPTAQAPLPTSARKRTAGGTPPSARPAKSRRTSTHDITLQAADLSLDG